MFSVEPFYIPPISIESQEKHNFLDAMISTLEVMIADNVHILELLMK